MQQQQQLQQQQLQQQQLYQQQQQQQYNEQQQAQQQTSTHPQRTSTEREVTGVYIPPKVNKRNEKEVTANPPTGKVKKKRVSFSEKPQIERETMPYSIVSDMMHMKSNITVAQLLNIPQYKKELKKALTPKRRVVRKGKGKGKEIKEMVIGMASSHTPMMCKGQVASWTIDLIIDSGSSVSIISKAFANHIHRSPDRTSTRTITGIHGDQKGSLGVINDIPVHLGDVIISTDMEVIDTQAYTMVLGNDWLQKAHAKIEYSPPRLTINDHKRMAVIECKYTTGELTFEEEEEEEEEEEDDDDESSDEENDLDLSGLSNMSLVVTEKESPDQHYYRFDPWGIEIDHETFSWEEYQLMNEKFNPWLREQRYRHKYKHWFHGPDASCWCKIKLITKEDECNQCKEDYERWCTLQVIPTKDVQSAQANLVMGGSERLNQSKYKGTVEHLLDQYPQIIARDITELGKTTKVTHHIDTGGAQPIRQYPYSLSPKYSQFLKEEIERLKIQGLIVPSKSPWTSPALVVGKANGKLRLVVDYRKLNKVTKPDAYPLPKISDMLDALANCAFFSTLDLTSGFWQVTMDTADREKTAFCTRFGTYEFTVMPFGLMNAPATFQRLMNNVLYEVLWKFALVYMDDIIIFSKTSNEHENHLNQVFQLLSQAGLKLNPDKCDFYQNRILFLGHMISEEGIQPNPALVEKIKTCPRPTTKTRIRSFLGLASYYRRFIKNFSGIARPLYNLTKQDEVFSWTEDCENAYEHLKMCLTTQPVVVYPDFNKHFYLNTDASNYAIGVVLAQRDDNNHERVIAYASRVLTTAETHYTVTEKECLAVIWATKYFNTFLQGSSFSIITDHEAIPWLKKHKNPKGRLARWIIHLSEYEPYTIIRRKGSSHTNADALSRLETNPVDSLITLLH
jgi:RNase H-like domain found in reverse transcriptase/Reverse transcriptase (RNA-dependent DNA polymerase)/gag-polyprotein putative aspartyl protease